MRVAAVATGPFSVEELADADAVVDDARALAPVLDDWAAFALRATLRRVRPRLAGPLCQGTRVVRLTEYAPARSGRRSAQAETGGVVVTSRVFALVPLVVALALPSAAHARRGPLNPPKTQPR